MEIIVYNIQDGDLLNYPLVFLSGIIQPFNSVDFLTVTNKNTGTVLQWPIFCGYFKALVYLTEGQNNIILTFQNTQLSINLSYHRKPIEYFVRLVYVICKDDDGRIQGPEDVENLSYDGACKRIQIAGTLMQTFIAEKMYEHGFSRKTFQLEVDSNGYPKVDLLHFDLTVEEVYHLSNEELWSKIAQALWSNNPNQMEKCKVLAFLSCTRYHNPDGIKPKSRKDTLKYTNGYIALGGGGLAVFGSAGLYTWAQDVSDIYSCLRDDREIDSTKFMDEGGKYRRGTFGGNYSMGLGGACHELGHVFNLGHNSTGIMSSDYHEFSKAFLIHDTCRKKQTFVAKNGSVNIRTNPEKSECGNFHTFPLKRKWIPSCESNLNESFNDDININNQEIVPSETDIPSQYYTDMNTSNQEIKSSEKSISSTNCNLSAKSSDSLKLVQNFQKNLNWISSVHNSSLSGVSENLKLFKTNNKETSYLEFFKFPNLVESHLSEKNINSRRNNADHFSNKMFRSNIDAFVNNLSITDCTTIKPNSEKNQCKVHSPNQIINDKSIALDTKFSDYPSKYSCIKLMSSNSFWYEEQCKNIDNVLIEKHSVIPISDQKNLSCQNSLPKLPFSVTESQNRLENLEKCSSYVDDGAHLHRSNAVLLNYHKWFNPSHPDDDNEQPELNNFTVSSKNGLRLLELRTEPDELTFFYWEFLDDPAPTTFTIKSEEVIQPAGVSTILIVAEDSFGNICHHHNIRLWDIEEKN